MKADVLATTCYNGVPISTSLIGRRRIDTFKDGFYATINGRKCRVRKERPGSDRFVQFIYKTSPEDIDRD